ncbi:MAG: cupredoxin domain-containing protein [Chloroflexota bacterium]
MKPVLFVVAALALAATLAACGGAASPSPTAVDVTLTATEFAFDPNTVEVTAGSQVRFTLANKGTLEHDVTIDALNYTLLAAVGESPSSATATLAAGTYDFHCSIPGHKEAGMTGTLTVK